MLTFDTLRAANAARVLCFKNAKGEIAHPGGVDDWDLSKWSNATLGELGEAANMIKKVERGDYALDDEIVDDKTGEILTVCAALAKEIADVVCYLDLLAYRARIDLGAATMSKFNEISERVGAPIFIHRFEGHGGAPRAYDVRTGEVAWFDSSRRLQHSPAAPQAGLRLLDGTYAPAEFAEVSP